VQEVLDRAASSPDRRLDRLHDGPTTRLEASLCFRDRLRKALGIARRFGEPEFELRLYERDSVGVASQPDARKLGRGDRQREVGEVDRHDTDHVGNVGAIEFGEVCRFQIDNTRVLSKRAEQLPVAAVDRVDLARASLEKNAGESARRCADVERDSAVDDDLKCL